MNICGILHRMWVSVLICAEVNIRIFVVGSIFHRILNAIDEYSCHITQNIGGIAELCRHVYTVLKIF